MLKHLDRYNLIHFSQHGSVKDKSTTTALIEIQEQVLKVYTEKVNSALVTVDQSLAYDIVSHPILMRKMEHLHFSRNTLNLMKDYLDSRSQLVHINGANSPPELTGPISVSQGSVLSCVFFIIYTLDFPEIYHTQRHEPTEYFKCSQSTMTLFVDDATVLIKQPQDKTLQQQLEVDYRKIQNYLSSNRLSQNDEKTKIMVITRDPKLRQIQIKTQDKKGNDKIIKHQDNIKILGLSISHNLKWDHYIHQCKKSLSSQLKKRLSAIKMISKYAPPKFTRMMTEGILHGKIRYGLELWGGTTQKNIQIIQKIQSQAANYIIGPTNIKKKSTNQILSELKWENINTMIRSTTLKSVHKIMQNKKPTQIYNIFTNYPPKQTKIKTEMKISSYHHGTSVQAHNSFMIRARFYNSLPKELTLIAKKIFFSKRLRRYLINPKDLPRIKEHTMMYNKQQIDEETKQQQNPTAQ